MTKTFRDEQNTVAAPDENTRQELDAPREKHSAPKSEPAPQAANKVRYGHAHARTEQLYQERRARYELKKQQEAAQAAREQQARTHEESPSVEARASETAPRTPHLESAGENASEGFGRERVKELALDAVKSVIGAAREAVHGHPLVGARKLAGDALSGALKVAREVTSRPTSPSGGEH
ncbi:hypothetical protein D187_002493 [Cystobacter fuscus DSM 2262]|uniref:Uncharacterized protein n=1 Tax=Cystobacter fuscus (strain ATCC 25194 / DSM 2262 / NBRC 100088 / M29) TaxID=1242864 RepID=S9QEK3_CYSF2|nr:hypothetical protein [Cystobacter fuscus]EPX59749.1 hypothetical protein D187_002493 [Cystobacter fuscus DSM 2262]